jgi:membrane protease YdiL (CAAX protease family)
MTRVRFITDFTLIRRDTNRNFLNSDQFLLHSRRAMNENPPARSSTPTWIGLFIALFGILIVRAAVYAFYPPFSFPAAIWRESLNWACVIALVLIIRFGERLSLRSVGIGHATLLRSLGWGVVLTLICMLLGAIVIALTHYTGGPSGAALAKLPVWLVTLIVLRAGVLEELFYRGYAIERLQALGFNRYWAGTIPLVIFSFGHWTGGWANIVIALVLGAALTFFYLWRRDLVANMTGHFLVDFISNVLPRLF